MSDYTAVATKAKAMYGKCLSYSDFEALINKNNVSDIVAYLKNTSYSDVFKDLKESDIHRGIIEKRLWSEIVNEYKRILNFVDSKKATILEFWFKRREIDYLKHRIMKVFNNENENFSKPDYKIDEFFFNHSAINFEILNKSKSLDDILEAVRRTQYYEVIIRAKSAKADYFSLSMTLDGLYYKMLWETCEKNLSGIDKELFKKYIGNEADMLNIIWIYRGKKFFNLDNKIIYTYLLPVNYKLSKELIAEMAESESADDLPKILDKTKYKDMFNNVGDGYFIEENYRARDNAVCRRIFREHADTVAGLYAYLKLKELEIFNITRVIEGVRYNINTELIRKHLRLE